MKLFPDDHETITGIARRLRSGETTCVEVLQTCLDRIEEKEADVRAWVLVDRDGAMQQARTLDEELKAGHNRGPLHGIPIGIKDIIDVRGMPTSYGLAGHRWANPQPAAEHDAPIVARLREAGAVILGKTVSTPFAWIDPPVTRNPWNLDRTPGGSSSGSAAAVACGMCLGAIGTQTGGSITRPAAFCGAAGMKPTFGQISSEGILPLAPSLDHYGPIARSVGDLRVLYEVVLDPDFRSEFEIGLSRDMGGAAPPRLVHLIVKAFFGDRGPDEVESALDGAVRLIQAAGARVQFDRLMSFRFRDLLESHHLILAAEATASHGTPKACRERYFLPDMQEWFFPTRLRELLEEGDSISATRYIHALEAKKLPEQLDDLLSQHDALVMPAALGPAPDPSTTGDPAYNSPWSLLGLPTVSFPLGLSVDGLPLAIQLIGRAGSDFHLLRTAEWCEAVIRESEGSGT